MLRHPTIIAWFITALLAGVVFLAAPLVIMTLGSVFMRNPGHAAHLLSAMILILQLSFATSVILTLWSGWRWTERNQWRTDQRADPQRISAVIGAVSVLGQHDGIADDDIMDLLEDSQPGTPLMSGHCDDEARR